MIPLGKLRPRFVFFNAGPQPESAANDPMAEDDPPDVETQALMAGTSSLEDFRKMRDERQ